MLRVFPSASAMKKTQYIGFGFKPDEGEYHFYVIIPTGRQASDIISVYERYHWDSDGTQEIRCEQDSLKVQMPRSKWRLMADTVKNEFNSRLKQSRNPVGKFSSGGVPLEKLFGKELIGNIRSNVNIYRSIALFSVAFLLFS